MAELSRWRAISRRVISNAYPFGERKNHPYKMWLAEVKLALKGSPTRSDTPRLEWRPELKVWCPHCSPRRWKSCLGCMKHHWQLEAIEADRVLLTMFEAVRGEPNKAAYSAIADYLREKDPMFAKLADLFETMAGGLE